MDANNVWPDAIPEHYHRLAMVVGSGTHESPETAEARARAVVIAKASELSQDNSTAVFNYSFRFTHNPNNWMHTVLASGTVAVHDH